MVRSGFHATKAAKEALGLIGANAFVIERNRVIDAARIPSGVKRIPSGAFVGIDGGESADMIADERDCIAFICDDEGKRATIALAHYDDALALA